MEEISETVRTVAEISGGQYKYGFVTDIESEFAPKGLNAVSYTHLTLPTKA